MFQLPELRVFWPLCSDSFHSWSPPKMKQWPHFTKKSRIVYKNESCGKIYSLSQWVKVSLYLGFRYHGIDADILLFSIIRLKAYTCPYNDLNQPYIILQHPTSNLRVFSSVFRIRIMNSQPYRVILVVVIIGNCWLLPNDEYDCPIIRQLWWMRLPSKNNMRRVHPFIQIFFQGADLTL